MSCCVTTSTHLSNAAVDMSLGNLLMLADFYHVSTEYLLQQKLSELNLSTHLFLIKSYLFCRFIRCVNGFLMQRHNDNDDNKCRSNPILLMHIGVNVKSTPYNR